MIDRGNGTGRNRYSENAGVQTVTQCSVSRLSARLTDTYFKSTLRVYTGGGTLLSAAALEDVALMGDAQFPRTYVTQTQIMFSNMVATAFVATRENMLGGGEQFVSGAPTSL